MIQIRSEDFGYGDGYLDLGGREVQGNSILSAHIQRRTSGELVGLIAAAAICIWALTTSLPIGGKIGTVAFLALLVAGALREIQRNYVVALNIYQLGRMEVRGLNKAEAIEMQSVLDAARGSATTTPRWASALSADG